MAWLFEPTRRTDVDIEITQRNQFDNDDVNLADSLVRESIQNCLDASLYDHISNEESDTQIDRKVVVSFRWVKPSDHHKFKDLFLDQIPHARSSGLNLTKVDFDEPSALIIEDFGTTGLLGATDEKKKDEDFTNFLRAYGKSGKSGSKKGRHGLGKLVLPLTSSIGVFFALTKRYNDEKQYLMGQSVLNIRKVDGKEYPPHGFFCQPINKDDEDPIQMPFSDEKIISEFSSLFSINRKSESGLSVVIPFPDLEFNEEELISKAIENYFYAIFSKKLTLKFNDITIDDSNIRDLAQQYSKKMKDSDHIFNFLDEVFEQKDERCFWLKDSLKDGRINASHFSGDELTKAREEFSDYKLVHIKVPISIGYRKSSIKTTEFDVYLKKNSDLTRGHALYFRGGLQLTGETKFSTEKAIGAVIADEKYISELIGDAENEAHTKMVTQRKKLSDKYTNSNKTIPIIKNSIINLYQLIAGLDQSQDEKALINFFRFKKPKNEKNREKKEKSTKEEIEIQDNLKNYSISTIRGGFTLSQSNTSASTTQPITITIEVAYNRKSHNPFKKYKIHDFDLRSDTFKIDKEGIDQFEAANNRIILSPNKEKFKLSIVGFDQNRDLKVRVS